MSDLNIYGVGGSQYSSDYIGFTFNGVHSDTLGIKRTSEGSRFNENLLPTIQDKTVQVPGGDGMYHFGSYYTQRQFNISYAFDALTESQLARIKAVFGDKKIHDLIFDEAPYKVYKAKVTGSASIKHIPFAEGETNRIYKGEGSIQFTAYDPYARSVKKFLNQYDNINKDEWKAASGMLEEKGSYDEPNGNAIDLYNPGVKETDFILKLNFDEQHIPGGKLMIQVDGTTLEPSLEFNTIQAKVGRDGRADSFVCFNTKLNLIEGYKNIGDSTGDIFVKSGLIYNEYISGGTFFKIPQTFDFLEPDSPRSIQLIGDGEFLSQRYYRDISYDYIYF